MSDVGEIKDRLALSLVVGEVVKLTPAGSYLRGLCPFHHEKSPSFFVNDTMGYYKCFGCGEHGDIFSFVQKYEHLTFREALEYLAKKAGITLSSKNYDPQEKLRREVLAALQEAAEFYREFLATPAGAPFRKYLTKRQISLGTQKLFGLGAIGSGWHDLVDYLRAKGYRHEVMLASGLAGESKTGRLFDRFRSRLMFPLKNHRAQVVGFSGRLLEENPHEGKYINTQETMVYHKGSMLYGLSELAREIKKAPFLLVVEGEFDVLSSVTAHVAHVVAIKGSALTSEQAKLASRYTQKIVLALDADAAGIKATKKAIEVLRPQGVEIEVLPLPAGSDPDNLASSNPAAWRELMKKTINVYEFFLQTTISQHDLSKISEQKKVVQECAGFFKLIDNRLEYEFFLKKLSGLLKQDPEIIRQDLLSWGKLSPAASSSATQVKPKVGRKLSKLQRLEAYVWFLFLHCLQQETLIQTASWYIENTKWSNDFLQHLATFYHQYYQKHPQPSLSAWQKTLPGDYQEKIALLLLHPSFVKIFAKANLATEWQTQSQLHERLSKQKQVSELSAQLQELEKIADPTLEQEQTKQQILQQILDLQKSRCDYK